MEIFDQVARSVAMTGRIEAADLAELRRAIYNDGVVSRAEGEALFEIERVRSAHSDGWSELFVEALTDYAIKQEPPEGYLSDDTAAWITAEISKRKRPSSDAEVELVINLIEKAREVPAAFSSFALRLVKDMVLYGDGVDARGRPHDGGRVSEADINSLQRIVWGAGSEGLMAVSRAEAEALFSIAHASAGHDNDPKFDDFFAKAIGNYLLGATGRAVPAREVAFRWETESTYKKDAVNILGAVFGKRRNANWGQLKDPGFYKDTILNARTLAQDLEIRFEQENVAYDAAQIAASVMTADKAGWLLDHIDQNGVMTEPEKALVRFIRREASALDPSLAKVLEKAV